MNRVEGVKRKDGRQHFMKKDERETLRKQGSEL